MHSMLITALVGAALVLLAWLLWFIVRSWDRANSIVQAATPLPIKLVNVWDRVWIRGDMACAAPLAVPWFGYSCVHFTYRLEEEVVRVEKDQNGNERRTTTWELRDSKDGATPFRVCQGRDALEVDAARAKWHYESAATHQVGSWRHSCTYLAYPGLVSVIGVVGEKKVTLEPLQNVPLVVTPRDRTDYMKAVERSESWAARFGLLFLWAGFTVAAFGLLRYAQSPGGIHSDGWWDARTGLLAASIALAATAFFWALRTYNSLVVYRTRAQQSWSQIDVHLKQRYDLIPNLVEVVRAYMAHEKSLLESLTAARSQALTGGMQAKIGAETAAAHGLSQIMLRAEKYPDLKANKLFAKFSDQITALEDKIAHARGFFNDSVAEYNTHVGVFPASIIAGMCKFAPYPLFAADLEERAAPAVQMR